MNAKPSLRWYRILAPEGLLVLAGLGHLAALDVADDLPRQLFLAPEGQRADAAQRQQRLEAVRLRVVLQIAADTL